MILQKLCEERRFWVLKTLKPRSFRGLRPLDPRRDVAPGPHTVKTFRSLRSLRSTWTQTIFIQHPTVTNPAHAPYAVKC